MAAISNPDSIRIGLVADEPIRLAGLITIFDLPAEQNQARLIPVTGSIDELLASARLEYIVIDLHAVSGLNALEIVRGVRPDMRLIVIGPEGDDELVMNSIVAGARAYLDLTAGPEIVRKAIDVVTSGSIWAPRRLLSQLIDRLLKLPDNLTVAHPQLTVRERQVLELILTARSNREIASQLGIEERTVKSYVGSLMRKTGADNRVKLSMSALSLALVSQKKHEKQGGTSDTAPRDAAPHTITNK
jgi:DNA-binding NarL/FixJ family response regulator